jgi:hypothetical protein
MVPISSLEPKEELEKYHLKRNYVNSTPSPPKNVKKSKKL